MLAVEEILCKYYSKALKWVIVNKFFKWGIFAGSCAPSRRIIFRFCDCKEVKY